MTSITLIWLLVKLPLPAVAIKACPNFSAVIHYPCGLNEEYIILIFLLSHVLDLIPLEECLYYYHGSVL